MYSAQLALFERHAVLDPDCGIGEQRATATLDTSIVLIRWCSLINTRVGNTHTYTLLVAVASSIRAYVNKFT